MTPAASTGLLNRTEGILAALESSHAVAWVIANAPKMDKDAFGDGFALEA